MRIVRKVCILTSWLLLFTTVLSGCTYYSTLVEETEREIRTKKELEVASEESEKIRVIAGKRKARLKELKKQIAAIGDKQDKLERRKKEKEDKINELYAKKRQLKKSRERLIKKRKEELLRVKEEFEPEIKRLKDERDRKKNEVSTLQERHSE